MLDLEKALQNMKEWAKEVGDIQKKNLGRSNLLINSKSTLIDLVTEIDEISEEIIKKRIIEHYPDHGILAEETGKSEKNSEYLWVVDPLDGTVNYAQGIPVFSISIALQKDGESIVGVVYVPMLDEMFEAIKGKGAFLNGKRISVARKNKLDDAMLATGFPYDRAESKDNNVNYFTHFITKVRGIRRMGVASIDLTNVAMGRYDGYWEINLKPWDVAAGTLILEEAGGTYQYLENKRGVSIVSGNREICDLIIKHMCEVDSLS